MLKIPSLFDYILDIWWIILIVAKQGCKENTEIIIMITLQTFRIIQYQKQKAAGLMSKDA